MRLTRDELSRLRAAHGARVSCFGAIHSEIRGIPSDSSLSIDAIRSENRYFCYNFKVSIEERFFTVNSLSLALKK